MPITDDQGHSVKNRIEQSDLVFKTCQRVAVAFYLETVERAIDERKINSGSTMSYPQLLQKHSTVF